MSILPRFALLWFASASFAWAGKFTLDKAAYQQGDDLIVTWSREDAEAKTALDWIGIYSLAQTPGSVGSTVWFYLNGTQTPPAEPIPNGSHRVTGANLPAGSWVARFFADDGYREALPAVAFTVTAPPATSGTPPSFVLPRLKLRHAVVGAAYSAKVGAAFWEQDSGDRLTFSKVNGAGWLTVAEDGTVTGTPGVADVGQNTFLVQAKDLGGNTATGEVSIQVFPLGGELVERLDVMTFNVWLGAGSVSDGSRKGLHAILLSGVDLIGIQENQTAAARWAASLGWHHVQTGDSAVLSKYPIVASAGGVEATVRLTNEPRQDVVLRSVHLTAYPYGPYDACFDRASNAALISRETSSGRVGQIQTNLNALKAKMAVANVTPILLVGDFNCPSHLDWMADTAATHCGYVVDWPVTKKCAEAGFVDVFRAIHPDPKAVPGATWSPVFTKNQGRPEPQDRIDMIHHLGSGLTPVDARVYTTAVEKTDAAYGKNTWPSDHAAVTASYHVRPLDSDRDGLADAWERAHFGDLAQTGMGDSDGDGLGHFGEYLFDQSPTQSGPAPVLSVAVENGNLLARLNARGDARFQLEWSADLKEWRPAKVLAKKSRWRSDRLLTHEWSLAEERQGGFLRVRAEPKGQDS